MKKGLIALGVVLLLVFMVSGSLIGRYNGFVTSNEQIDGAWAQVENVLQRRGDLIPNLVSTVPGLSASADQRCICQDFQPAVPRIILGIRGCGSLP